MVAEFKALPALLHDKGGDLSLIHILDKSGYIVADESTRTNLPGVFAVGDVRTKALRQVVTAVSDGAVAVHYAEAVSYTHLAWR